MSNEFRRVSLLGAPTDVGAGRPGASMGPQAMRVAGLRAALERQGVAVEDLGDLAGPGNPQGEAEAGYRHLSQVQAWATALRDAVHAELRRGRLPVTLGGDHSLAIGSIGAVARHCREAGRPLRVIWLDAHADFNTPATSPTGNLHGMPVACLCGLGPDSLVSMAGMVPALAAQEKQLVRDAGVEIYDMRHLDEVGMRATMEQALRDVRPDVHLHVSFDVDFLDPEIAPGVPTAVRGGPTYREAQLCMEMLADTGCLGSLDVVELNPALDVRNRTAELVVDLLESLFGKSTLIR